MRVDFSNQSEPTVGALETVVEGLRSSYEKAVLLLEEIEGMKWSGEHRDHAKAMLEIIMQYHRDLLEASVEVEGAIKPFREYFERYSSLISYRAIEDIDGE